ncbi:hypothetical protein E2C01_024712 [Portunus trituberculatus]|uniref:Uncharacterized protein n=1 Tax=Portunus trituberculatus TaxID=210409 RepID=A0A5B7EFW9_PORTR|nr:hypothetical protein [Portunus trituberculatus]
MLEQLHYSHYRLRLTQTCKSHPSTHSEQAMLHPKCSQTQQPVLNTLKTHQLISHKEHAHNREGSDSSPGRNKVNGRAPVHLTASRYEM